MFLDNFQLVLLIIACSFFFFFFGGGGGGEVIQYSFFTGKNKIWSTTELGSCQHDIIIIIIIIII